MTQSLLLKNARTIATMDDELREIANGFVLIRGNRIVGVGPAEEAPTDADRVIDMTGHVVIPGLINTHHHMFQSLTRALPAAQNGELFDWLSALFPVWRNITPAMQRAASRTAMAELMLSGCTTAADHAYLHVNGITLDDSVQAATEMGIRFHGARGAMSLGQSRGGLPPDDLVEADESAILKDMQRVVETHHDHNADAMVRVALAPCSPFTVSTDLMREAATMARALKVGLHTHTAENWKDVAFSKERYGMTPTEFTEAMGWVGDDVWHAHCVHLDEPGIALFARTGTGVAHCPCSNMRLASGIAPIRKMLDAGVKVGLGVDGSASNDSGNLLDEARLAMLSARVRDQEPGAMTAREALRVATRGGAEVLGRGDALGRIQAGYCADIVAFRTDDIAMAGGQSDPLASLVFCTPPRVAWSIINGRVVIEEGELRTRSLPHIIEEQNGMAGKLLA
ncbi:8-oxoguanine deaminase [Hydrocarboniclastica marina]|uniref:8-oxoguanine deaminase n=1 Tax=Hydrocarboniclastica marina TaxID=2259620 RepID=A0A4P7XLY0_9ALTE|nr:8-oxoguanine deaminase [Hydrocarboniclastica marina]MAM00133.1 8-oxoguanine deaminase [Alteromonadaceae bacterium]QCF27442.1 8-oxoguanine deaminase [Hydrocarboniclastica marina]